MPRITSSDQVLRLIRQQLEKTAKSSKASVVKKSAGRASGLELVKSIAQRPELPEEEVKRAVVENLLSESLGRSLINAPEFQRIVDQITKTLEEDADSSLLLQSAVEKLRE